MHFQIVGPTFLLNIVSAKIELSCRLARELCRRRLQPGSKVELIPSVIRIPNEANKRYTFPDRLGGVGMVYFLRPFSFPDFSKYLKKKIISTYLLSIRSSSSISRPGNSCSAASNFQIANMKAYYLYDFGYNSFFFFGGIASSPKSYFQKFYAY